MAASPFRAGGEASPSFITSMASTTVSNLYLTDISEYQPDIADTAYLAWSKAMVIRAAFGDAHDDSAWYGGARRKALHAGGARFLGIYQYLVAGQDGTAQADALHNLVGPLQPGEVLIADFEQGEKSMLSAWYNRMLAIGYPHQFLWTYTGLDFGQAQGALPVEWVAAYQATEPTTPHVLWQFSGNYAVPGVGVADCSVYHGTIDQLAALAYQPGTVPTNAPALTPAPQGLKTALGSLATFTWLPVAGQAGYHFQMEWYKQGFGWDLTNDAHVPDESCTVTLAMGTRYRWRVAAGTSGYTWAGWQEFSTP